MSKTVGRYALITPAHNEAEYIGRTINSVLAQTVLPMCWVIVSDRSSDGTDAIIIDYSRRVDFIRYVRAEGGSERGTPSKVAAIRLALKTIVGVDYDFVGNLDADVSFGPRYFEFLLRMFIERPELGIVGGRIHLYQHGRLVEYRSSLESVAGAVQLFRRSCFETIGGYSPLPDGFEDGLVEIEARRCGWKTRSFREQIVVHHRQIGTIGRSIWRHKFESGVTEYRIGFGIVYHLARAMYYLLQQPRGIGSLLVVSGYTWAWASRKRKLLSSTTARYLRREQRERMKIFFVPWMRSKRK